VAYRRLRPLILLRHLKSPSPQHQVTSLRGDAVAGASDAATGEQCRGQRRDQALFLLLRTFASLGRRAGLAPCWTSVPFEQAPSASTLLSGDSRSPANSYRVARL
jgi:hypothetical protein